MKAKTVSEINAILIAKGYKSGSIIHNIPENKWGANSLVFDEFEDGYSRCVLCVFYPETGDRVLARLEGKGIYKKLKAADKKEFQALIESLPTNQPK